MEISAVAGLVLAAAALCALLRRYHAEYALAVSVGVGALIAVQMISSLVPIVAEIENLMEQAGVAGICFLAQFAGDACRDAGESALAAKVEMAARLSMTAAALPLFQQLANTAVMLIRG